MIFMKKECGFDKILDKGIYKKEGCHPDNQSFQLTLKSNTMKNTVQNYCFSGNLQVCTR